MPCDSIQLNSIEIAKMNGALLKLALGAINAQGVIITEAGAAFSLEGVRCQIRGGKFIVQAGYEHLADRVRVAYSRQTVFHAARANGWKVKETRPNVFAVVK